MNLNRQPIGVTAAVLPEPGQRSDAAWCVIGGHRRRIMEWESTSSNTAMVRSLRKFARRVLTVMVLERIVHRGLGVFHVTGRANFAIAENVVQNNGKKQGERNAIQNKNI
jgi:hypothetical protein